MKWRLILAAATSALAGFLFGFDTVVISGAERAIQSRWELSPGLHGAAMGAAIWGTVLGACLGSWPTDHWGRRPTLTAIGLFYVASAVWSALAGDVWQLMAARFLGGIGVGVATVASPLFIAEIAPAQMRGRLAGLFQFNIVLGIVCAFASNTLLAEFGDEPWRAMLGAEALPALLYTMACCWLPESPRWLLRKRGDREAALQALRKLQGESAEAERILDDLAEANPSARSSPGPFWSRRLRRPISLAILLAVFNQLSGINAVLYYAPRIFELAGLEAQAALLQSVGIGVVNLVFTMAGLWLIDRAGRRALLLIGSVGYIVSLSLCALGFSTGQTVWVPACLFLFIAAHAIGQGTVIWVFIAEIFPTGDRARGQSLGSFTHWICAAALTTLFPTLVTAFSPAQVFAFFSGMMVLQLVWVLACVPETRGATLESLGQQMSVPAPTTSDVLSSE